MFQEMAGDTRMGLIVPDAISLSTQLSEGQPPKQAKVQGIQESQIILAHEIENPPDIPSFPGSKNTTRN